LQQEEAKLARADAADSGLRGDAEKDSLDQGDAEQGGAEEAGDAQEGGEEEGGDEDGGDEEGAEEGGDDAMDEPDEKLVCMWRQTGDCRADGPR